MYKVKAGIFAAGKGERIKKSFPDIPKPLIKISNKNLIEIAIENIKIINPSNLTILLNNENLEPVINYLGTKHYDFIAINSKTSFESFYTLASFLNDGVSNLLLSTVDVIIEPEDLKTALELHISTKSYITLGISNIPLDEKPLLVDIDNNLKIKSIGKKGNFATNGIYILSPLAVLNISQVNYLALREFLSSIDFSTHKVYSYFFKNSFDIDDETDIIKVKEFLDHKTY
ncbi:MAG: sugar phosphate nucleotidyltransferase [Elusimicrobiales bacterium]|nr:sugar phosphate nucleotidyltransferase [Elusimicrobiales bacterium]